ncbi:MAG: FKBP-type peptidyl-prolyl cis-trans isomerase [Bacteroidetes bacterium]|nr:FKBP-type peptidyl-prolyl cis-trans isomerase [Bacteroidota bacterium]
MRFLPWFLALTVLGLGACSKKKCDYTDDGVIAPMAEQNAIKKYLDSAGIKASLHERGFYYKIDSTVLGTGANPGECSPITVAYTGTLTDGTIFDQQNSYATQLSNLIDGWQQGVPLIKKGGRIWLYIPPSLGYGSQSISAGNVTIPASSILIFDIHLLDVQ